MYRYDDHDDPPYEPYDWDALPALPESLEVVTEDVNRAVESLKDHGFLVKTEDGVSLTDAGNQALAMTFGILVEASFELFRHWVTATNPDPNVVGNGTEFMAWLIEQWDSHGLA